MSSENQSSEPIYQIKVTLKESTPPIWRRILVSGGTSLHKLHLILQASMGWDNYHLHMFEIAGQTYGDPAEDPDDELGAQDETQVTLRDLGLAPGAAFEYEYDFGDSWRHLLNVEEIREGGDTAQLPRCTAGKGAAPPEDVGGVYGYEEYLAAIQDPNHPEHEEMLAWRGPFDPAEFDIADANARLAWLSGAAPDKLGLEAAQAIPLVRAYYPVLFRWAATVDDEQIAAAAELSMRRDMIVFLTYLRDHKVNGTQGAGNLPLKPAKEMAANFVNPPQWEIPLRNNETIRVRSSEEIWTIFFLKGLAEVGELLEGGSARRFRLTPAGAAFLEASAPLQVWHMFATWWTQVNWLVAYPYEGMGQQLPPGFAQTTAELLMQLPTGQPVEFPAFAARLIAAGGLKWGAYGTEGDLPRTALHGAILRMVIYPLSYFGALTFKLETVTEAGYSSEKLTTFTITPFGHSLLSTLE